MGNYSTTGQVARRLRISVSSLKRWLGEPDLDIVDRRNSNGWRLFSEEDVQILKDYKRKSKKKGKRFTDTTLVPVVLSSSEGNRA